MAARRRKTTTSFYDLDGEFEGIGRVWGLRLLRKLRKDRLIVSHQGSIGSLLGISAEEDASSIARGFKLVGEILEGLETVDMPEPRLP